MFECTKGRLDQHTEETIPLLVGGVPVSGEGFNFCSAGQKASLDGSSRYLVWRVATGGVDGVGGGERHVAGLEVLQRVQNLGLAAELLSPDISDCCLDKPLVGLFGEGVVEE